MAVIYVNWNPPPSQLRLFAVLETFFFGIVAGVVLQRGGSVEVAVAVFVVAAAVGLLGLLRPRWIRPVYIVWMAAVYPLGWVVSHVVLAAVFYLLFTPVGLVMRLAGHDPMERRFEPEAGTYWKPRTQPNDASRYFKQY